MTRMPLPTGRGSRVALIAAAALTVPAAAFALPPAGTDDEVGTPPGSVEVTTPEVPAKGKVGFCVRNFRVDLKNGGSVGQQFMMKFDDFGQNGIGPFTPDASGTFCGEISMNPADYAGTKGGAADAIPPGLCDTSKPHSLRFLSGPWAYDKNGDSASMRSFRADFRVTGSCTAPPPPPTGPTPGPTQPTPEQPTAPGAEDGSTVVRRPKLRARVVSTNGTTLRLNFQPVSTHTKVRISLRTRVPVKIGKRKRIVRLVSSTPVEIPADGRRHTAVFRLTPACRQIVASKAKRSGVLIFTLPSGKAQGIPLSVVRSGTR